MSLVILVGTNPRLSLFMGFSEVDSSESAGAVTEQLGLQSRTTLWAQPLQSRGAETPQISLHILITTCEHDETNLEPHHGVGVKVVNSSSKQR